jgi:hypothetical protein
MPRTWLSSPGLRFVTFEALELGDLRSCELVCHVAPGLGGVVGCGHGVQSVRPDRCWRESKVTSWVYRGTLPHSTTGRCG